MVDIIRTYNLTKRFGEKIALNSLCISLEPNHIYGLIGPEGAGKTTLIRLLAGLYRPSEGSISLFGEKNPAGLNRARKRIGFLVEDPIAEERFSVRQNLEMQAMLSGRTSKAKLKELRHQLGFRDCSVWEQKRYGLAAALLGEPELLVLDEPLNGLDPEGCQLAAKLLMEMNRKNGVTMLISACFPRELFGFATDYLFLNEGRLMGSMSASELEQKLESASPEELELEFLQPRMEKRGDS